MDKSNKNEYFNLDFFVSFLDGLDHNNSYVVTMIDSICKEVIDNADKNDSPEFIKESMNRIIYQCSQLMKLSEIYSAVANLVSDNGIEKGSINAGTFVSDYVKNCREYLNNDIFKLSVTNSLKGKDIFLSFENIFVDKKILEFVITISLRKMITKGARKIKLAASNTNDEIIISLKTLKADEPVPEEIMPEFISVSLSDNIIKAAADKLNSKFDVRDKEAEFRIPIDPVIILSQPIREYKSYFNMFNNLLSDLEALTSCTRDNKK